MQLKAPAIQLARVQACAGAIAHAKRKGLLISLDPHPKKFVSEFD